MRRKCCSATFRMRARASSRSVSVRIGRFMGLFPIDEPDLPRWFELDICVVVIAIGSRLFDAFIVPSTPVNGREVWFELLFTAVSQCHPAASATALQVA